VTSTFYSIDSKLLLHFDIRHFCHFCKNRHFIGRQLSFRQNNIAPLCYTYNEEDHDATPFTKNSFSPPFMHSCTHVLWNMQKNSVKCFRMQKKCKIWLMWHIANWQLFQHMYAHINTNPNWKRIISAPRCLNRWRHWNFYTFEKNSFCFLFLCRLFLESRPKHRFCFCYFFIAK
jgi:hypothetical protein